MNGLILYVVSSLFGEREHTAEDGRINPSETFF
jgi:hypothetical protein